MNKIRKILLQTGWLLLLLMISDSAWAMPPVIQTHDDIRIKSFNGENLTFEWDYDGPRSYAQYTVTCKYLTNESIETVSNNEYTTMAYCPSEEYTVSVVPLVDGAPQSDTAWSMRLKNYMTEPQYLKFDTVDENNVTISWTYESSSISGFEVQCTKESDVPLINLTKLPASARSFSVADLEPNTSYRFSVMAYVDSSTNVNPYLTNTGGSQYYYSPRSSISTITIPGGSNITLTCTEKSDTSLTFAWAGNLSYQLFRGSGSSPIATSEGGSNYTDTGLTPNTSYTYTLKGFNGASLVGEDSITVSTLALPPGSTVDDIRIKAVTNGEVTVDWAYDTSFFIEQPQPGFKIKREIIGKKALLLADLPFNSPEYTITNYSSTDEYVFSAYYRDYSGMNWNIHIKNYMSEPRQLKVDAVDDTSLTLSWKYESPAIDGFEIYRNGTLVSTRSGSDRNFLDTGLAANTSYNYKVVGFINGITSPLFPVALEGSNYHYSPESIIDVTTLPTGGGSNDVTLTCINKTTNSLSFAWKGSLNYKLYKGSSSTPIHTSSGGNNYKDTGLSQRTSYSYTLKGYNGATLVGEDTLTVSTLGLNPPGSFTATATGRFSIDLTWDNSNNTGISSYRINKKASEDSEYHYLTSLPTSSTSFTDDDLLAGTTYQYRIYSIDPTGGASSYSYSFARTNSFQATTGFELDSHDMYNINFHWKPSNIPDEEMSQYKLYKRGPGETEYSLVQTTDKNIRNFSDSGLKPGMAYYYKLEATDTSGKTSVPIGIAYSTKPFPAPAQDTVVEDYYNISFSWLAPSEVAAVTEVKKYLIYRRKGNEIETQLQDNWTTLSYNDTDLDSNTSYHYRIAAVDQFGNKSLSLYLARHTKQIPAVQSLQCDTTKSKTYQLTFTWQPPAEPPVVGYNLNFDGQAITLNKGTDYPEGTETITYTTTEPLFDETAHSFSVVAFDHKGGISASASANATTLTLPPPEVIAQTQKWTYKNELNWSKPASIQTEDIGGYRIQRVEPQKSFADQTALFLRDNKLKSGQAYQYKLWTIDIKGNISNNSESVTFETLPFTPPVNLTQGETNTYKMVFSWDKPADPILNDDIAGYKVYQGESLTPIATLGKDELTYAQERLKPDAAYQFSVRAFDPAGNLSQPVVSPAVDGEGAWKTIVFNAPQNLAHDDATLTTCNIDLSWQKSPALTDVVGYKVFKNGGTVSESGLLPKMSDEDEGQQPYTYKADTLKPYTKYTFAVCAVDKAGNLSLPAKTDPEESKTLKFHSPGNFKVTSYNTCRVHFSWVKPWRVPVFEGYKIFVEGQEKPILTIENKDILSTSGTEGAFPLKNAENYKFVIRAFDKAGNLSYASYLPEKTYENRLLKTADLTAPKNLRAITESETAVTLTWDPPEWEPAACSHTELVGYRIYRFNGKEDVLVKTTSQRSCLVEGLTPGTPFRLSVCAYDTTANTPGADVNEFPKAVIDQTTVNDGPSSVLYEFADADLNTPLTLAVDTGNPGGNNAEVRDGSALCAYNDDGGSAIEFTSAAPLATQLKLQKQITWGRRFIMETKVLIGDEAMGGIELLNAVRTDTPTGQVLWTINPDRTVSLVLIPEYGIAVTSKQPVVELNEWTSLQVAVDMEQQTMPEGIKLYKNGQLLECNYPFIPWDFKAVAANFETSMTTVSLLKRSAPFSLKADFVKLRFREDPGSFNEDDFHQGEVAEEIDQDASATIVVDLDNVLKRVINHPNDFSDGKFTGSGSIKYDNHPNEESIFYGIFEINFGMEVNKYNGILAVDIMAKKPGANQAFKKIGQVNVDSNDLPTLGEGVKTMTYFWNARQPAYDWSKDDAKPYETQEMIQLKFVIR